MAPGNGYSHSLARWPFPRAVRRHRGRHCWHRRLDAQREQARPMIASVKRVKKLESALSGALRAGDLQADRLVELSNLTARQKRTLWRAFNLIERGRYSDAANEIASELLRDRERAR